MVVPLSSVKYLAPYGSGICSDTVASGVNSRCIGGVDRSVLNTNSRRAVDTVRNRIARCSDGRIGCTDRHAARAREIDDESCG